MLGRLRKIVLSTQVAEISRKTGLQTRNRFTCRLFEEMIMLGSFLVKFEHHRNSEIVEIFTELAIEMIKVPFKTL